MKQPGGFYSPPKKPGLSAPKNTNFLPKLRFFCPSKNPVFLRFLQCTNLTFGFAAAWLGGYVGRNILTETLSSEFIGFAGGPVFGKWGGQKKWRFQEENWLVVWNIFFPGIAIIIPTD